MYWEENRIRWIKEWKRAYHNIMLVQYLYVQDFHLFFSLFSGSTLLFVVSTDYGIVTVCVAFIHSTAVIRLFCVLHILQLIELTRIFSCVSTKINLFCVLKMWQSKSWRVVKGKYMWINCVGFFSPNYEVKASNFLPFFCTSHHRCQCWVFEGNKTI